MHIFMLQKFSAIWSLNKWIIYGDLDIDSDSKDFYSYIFGVE